MISLESDLQMSAQCDQKCVEAKIDLTKSEFNNLQNENKNQIQQSSKELDGFAKDVQNLATNLTI